MRVTIFDFDNTLFPSEDFAKKKCIDNPIKLARRICKVLNMALFFSDKVYIITNAEKEWVRLVMQDYLPECSKLYSLIETISIPDNKYNLGLPFPMWKSSGFSITLTKHFYDSLYEKTNVEHHLVSIGDCVYDHDAALRISDIFPNVIVKIARLKEYPTEADILLQLKILREGMQFLTEHSEHLDIDIKVSGKFDSLRENILTKIPLQDIQEEDENDLELEEEEPYIPMYTAEIPIVKIC